MGKSQKRFHRLASLFCAAALVFSCAAISACGNNVESGNTGAEGGQTAGGSYLYGTTAPAEGLGKAGDYYLDTESLSAYTKTESGEWVKTALYNGTGTPGANADALKDAADGDLYLDTAGGVLYQKDADGWHDVLKVKGRDGVVWFSGAEAPVAGSEALQGAMAGDFYLQTSDFTVWQLGADGKTWNKLGSIKGADGTDGKPGEDGAEGRLGSLWYYGTEAPEDKQPTARAGDFYMRTLPPYSQEGKGKYNGYKIYTYEGEGEEGYWKQIIDNSACTFLGVAHAFGEDNVCTNCGLENMFADEKYHQEADGKYTITEFPEDVDELVIPYKIGDDIVELKGQKSLGGNNNSTLKSVVLEEGFTELPDGNGVFSGFTALTSVTLPSTLTLIGNNSFRDCTSLKKINIPDGVTKIGRSAFRKTGLETIDIPGSVTELGRAAFRESALKKVNFSEGLTTIGEEVFRMTNLESVDIPDSVTTIQNCAFGECFALETVKIGKGLTKIEYTLSGGTQPAGIFFGDVHLHSVEFGAKMPEDNTTTLDTTNYHYPNGVSMGVVSNSTFSECIRLAEVIVPEGTELTAGDAEKYGGVAAHAIEVKKSGSESPSGIEHDENGFVFYTDKDGKKSLIDYMGKGGSITLPEGEPYAIHDYAFYNNKYYHNDENEKYYDEVITGVNFGNTATSIGSYAFTGTELTENLEIAGAITEIGAHAFENGITDHFIEVHIGNDVKKIGDYAFSGCNRLSYIYIGTPYFDVSTKVTSTLEEIGTGAFKGCAAFVNGDIRVFFRNTAERWKTLIEGKNVFEGISETQLLYVCSTDYKLTYKNGEVTKEENWHDYPYYYD